MMQWDALEREIFILSADFGRISKTLGALAAELQRERKWRTVRLMRAATDPDSPIKFETESGEPAQPVSPV